MTLSSRLAEALAVVKSLFGQGPTNVAGQHYRVTNLVGEPRPAQQPRPPILVGGGGRRLLTLGAREADIVSINPRASRTGGHDNSDIARETVAEKAAWVREAAGLRWEDLEVNLAVKGAAITDTPRAVLAPFVARHALPEATLLASPHLLSSAGGAVIRRQEHYATRARSAASPFANASMGGASIPVVDTPSAWQHVAAIVSTGRASGITPGASPGRRHQT